MEVKDQTNDLLDRLIINKEKYNNSTIEEEKEEYIDDHIELQNQFENIGIDIINEAIEEIKSRQEESIFSSEDYEEEKPEEEKETEDIEVKEENGGIKEEKSKNKNLKGLMAICAIVVFLVGGIYSCNTIFSKNKEVSAEKIDLADPSFNVSENNEKEEIIEENHENSVPEDNGDSFAINDVRDIEDTNVNSYRNDNFNNERNSYRNNQRNNYSEDRYNDDFNEIDKAIEDITGSNTKKTKFDEDIETRTKDSYRRDSGDVKLSYINRSKLNDSSSTNSNNNTNTNTNNISSIGYRSTNERINETENIKLNQNKVRKQSSKYEIKQGSIIPSILISEINTDLPGTILGQVKTNIYDSVSGKYLLVPKGSKIYGVYSSVIANGQNRVVIVWNKLILPNGDYVDLSNMQGVDLLGNTGIKDKVDNHTLELLGNAVLSSVLNFGNTVAKGISFNFGGKLLDLTGKTRENEKGNETSPFEKSTGKILERAVDRPPTITIRKGTSFNIMVNSDIELVPYYKGN